MPAKLSQRDLYLRKQYGITEKEYNEIKSLQKSVCFICQRPARVLCVDHRHTLRDREHRGAECRARVRGLLCWLCNRGLAKFRDNPERFMRAAEYLMNPPAQRILKGN